LLSVLICNVVNALQLTVAAIEGINISKIKVVN